MFFINIMLLSLLRWRRG